LEVSYSVLGINNVKNTIVLKNEELLSKLSGLNPTKQKPNYTKFAFLKENKKDKCLI